MSATDRSNAWSTGGGVSQRNGGRSQVSTAQAAPRLIGILRVLARYGLVGAIRSQRHWPSPVQVRTALEQLGVVYLKSGQVLALRRDLRPPAYVRALA